jgi:predicted nucleic acid-binding protein
MELNFSRGQMIFIDTSPIIYYFEENEKYIGRLAELFDSVYANDVQIVTSMITYIELISYPVKLGNSQLAAKYREYLTNSDTISLYPLNIIASEAAVKYRVNYGLRTPDAIQLGTAECCGADYVLTNDKAWKKIRELNIINIDDL